MGGLISPLDQEKIIYFSHRKDTKYQIFYRSDNDWENVC